MSERKSKRHANLHVRLSDVDNAFLHATQKEGGLNKTDVVVKLFQLGRALGTKAVIEAALHQNEQRDRTGKAVQDKGDKALLVGDE